MCMLFEMIPVFLFFLLFFSVLLVPLALWDGIKRHFEQPNKRLEKKFFRERFHYNWQ